jgi:hypothetical protein
MDGRIDAFVWSGDAGVGEEKERLSCYKRIVFIKAVIQQPFVFYVVGIITIT